MMGCDTVREQAMDYLTELLPDWQMEELGAHVARCAACRESVESAREELVVLEAWGVPGPEGDTTPEFMRRLRLHEATALARPAFDADIASLSPRSVLARAVWAIQRFRGLRTGAKIAVTSVSLLLVAALSALLALGPSGLRSVAQGGQPKVIEGVPPMDYSTMRYSYHVSALYSVLDYLGCPMGYDELMVASGGAFRVACQPFEYTFEGPQTVAPEDLVLNAAEAAGALAERRAFESQEEAWEAVCESIDAGRPVIAWQGESAQVICGYDPRTRTMYRWRYGVVAKEYEVVPFKLEPPGRPKGAPIEAVFVDYDLGSEPAELDWPRILERAVAYADWPDREPIYGVYVFGLAAYAVWADTFRAGPNQLGPQKDAEVIEAMTRTFADARTCAGAVLQRHGTIHASFAEAASHYVDEAAALQQIRNLLRQGTDPQADWAEKTQIMGGNFADPDVRELMAQLVERAEEEEVLAVECLREALADLGTATPEGAGPAPDAGEPPGVTADAEALYKRGLDLKRAGKHTEAAEALRQAIADDPDHLEAHWTLAWVFVELQDTAGAKQEFQRVIELAPGSDKANEAQKAIDRMK